MIEFELAVVILILLSIRNNARKIVKNLVPKGESSAVILSAQLMEQIETENKELTRGTLKKPMHDRHRYTTSLN